MPSPCESRTLSPPTEYLILQLHVLNFICPLIPDCLQFSQPVLVLRQLLISAQLSPLPPRSFSRPRSLHKTQTSWKVTAITLPYENWLSSPDLCFLFFSPLFVDSRTCFLMPEWLHFLRSFLCSLISSLSSFLG